MSNQAAWAPAKGAPIEVRPSPYPDLKPGCVIIKNHAVAINGIDHKMAALGVLVREWPAIFGEDVAGEVVDVADDVHLFKKGDRVMGNCPGLVTGESQEAGFQHYCRAPANMVTCIPTNVSFEEAAALPLSIACAAALLFEESNLGLPLPSKAAQQTNDTILIWGGSSSMGSTTIQFAKACGLYVVTTCSPRNFEYVRSLGADEAFDYSDTSIVEKLVQSLHQRECVGAIDTVGQNIDVCGQIMNELGGGRVVGTVPPRDALPVNVIFSHVVATSIMDNHIAAAVFHDFLPSAIKDKKFKFAQKPTIVGKGLDCVQAGLEKWRQGASATKLVITL